MAVAAAPDWRRLVSLAERHRVAPLVARALASADLPPDGHAALGELEEAARRAAYTNLLHAGELPRLLDRLTAAGVEAIPYKGPTLAATAYGSLTLRPFADLDLVVRDGQYERAKQTLVAAGFAPSADDYDSVRHLSHEQAFEARDGRLQVDLHGRLFSRELFPVELETLAERLETVRVGQCEIATFRPEVLAVVLCEHAHKHLWQRLVWLADLAHLIAARPEFDWTSWAQLARRTGSRRVAGIGMLLAAELLAAPIPPAVLDEQRADAVLAELAAEVRERLFASWSSDLVEVEFELSSLQWRSRERWRDRWRYALTPNESDWSVLPLPAALRSVYYLVRPFRLLGKYGLGRLRRLAG